MQHLRHPSKKHTKRKRKNKRKSLFANQKARCNYRSAGGHATVPHRPPVAVALCRCPFGSSVPGAWCTSQGTRLRAAERGYRGSHPLSRTHQDHVPPRVSLFAVLSVRPRPALGSTARRPGPRGPGGEGPTRVVPVTSRLGGTGADRFAPLAPHHLARSPLCKTARRRPAQETRCFPSSLPEV